MTTPIFLAHFGGHGGGAAAILGVGLFIVVVAMIALAFVETKSSK